MKKLITLLLALLVMFLCKAQDRPVQKNDTVYYKDKKFYLNQPLRLAYGSAADKSFAFVYIGTALTLAPAQAGWAKQDILIDKITFRQNKFWVRAAIVGNGPMLGNKIHFNVEMAVDNKEIE